MAHNTLTLLAVSVAVALFSCSRAHASEIFFDPAALEIPGSEAVAAVDLTTFEKPGGQLPGVYQVSFMVNNEHKGSQMTEFVAHDDKLLPLLTPAQLANMGVDLSRLPALADLDKKTVLDKPLYRYIPGARSSFDFPSLTVNISVPQVYMNKKYRGDIDPSLWDDGITALFSNYHFSGASSRYDNRGNNESYFLSLNNGLNVGPWRLRHSASGSWSEQESGHGKTERVHQWRNNETVLLRDIGFLRSRLAVGQTNTTADLFDSFPFTGVQLATEETMWADSRRNFAPVIRGIAGSSAKVTVRQNDSIIYQTWVPPGPFEIDDLPSGGTNGDLLVTVTEDSGKVQEFTVAYSSLALMLREGESRYAVSAGKYRQFSGGPEPEFAQFTLSHGFPWRMTGYTGALLAEDYQSAAAGIGVDAGMFGAFSGDVTVSSAELNNSEKARGQSYRLQYSKNMLSTGSTLTLAAYRYSTRDFYTFNEQIQDISRKNSEFRYEHSRRKNRLQVSLSQRFPDPHWGALYVTGLAEEYHGRSGREHSVGTGYNNAWKGVSYSLNYTSTRNPHYGTDHQFSLNLNVPLEKLLPSSWATYGFSTSKNGRTLNQAGLTGVALEKNNLSYGISQSYQNDGVGNSGSLSLGYTGSLGQVNGGYNYTRDTQRFDYGVRGGVLLHGGGVTVSPPLSGGMTPAALVRIRDESGIALTSAMTTTDWRGYAVIPSISAYRSNSIGVDTQSLPDEVDIRNNMQQVIPSAGAIVLADFPARRGKQALIRLAGADGRPVPFGAMVSVEGEPENTSIVGEAGEVYLSGLESRGRLLARWGNGKECRAAYTLTGGETGPVVNATARCE